MRADFNPATPLPDPTRSVTPGSSPGCSRTWRRCSPRPATATTRSAAPPIALPVTAVGIPGQLVDAAPALEDRLPGLPTDEAAWRLVLADPRYAIVDLFYGAIGGPQGDRRQPGDRLTVTDPRTGGVDAVVAGPLSDATRSTASTPASSGGRS